LTPLQVALTLAVLKVVGVKLRKDDPAGMKLFIESLQARVADAKSQAAQGEVTYCRQLYSSVTILPFTVLNHRLP
jgi:hypothetical protein